MTNMTQLENELRRTLRSAADALTIDEEGFDLGRVATTGLDELPAPARGRGVQRSLLVAAVLAVALVTTTVVMRNDGHSGGGIHVGDAPTTSVAAPTTSLAAPTTSVSIPPAISGPAPAALVAKVASVPVDVLRAVGAGSAQPLPHNGAGQRLTQGDKPVAVWIGAEYCPFCAAQRWPLVVALSRFGTFSGLQLTSSAIDTTASNTNPDGTTTYTAAPEIFPGTQTFSFHGSTYSSPYLEFESVETTTNALAPDLSKFVPLDTPTPAESALMKEFDAPPYTENAGAIPFVDLGNWFLVSGATFSPAVLQGKTVDDIANALSDPTSDVAKAVDGAANVITAAICRLTLNQPSSVCSDPAVAALGPSGPQ